MTGLDTQLLLQRLDSRSRRLITSSLQAAAGPSGEESPTRSLCSAQLIDEYGVSMENSRFWDELGAEHDRALQDHGPELIKRQQALRYFTWTWRWRALPKSEQFRFLLGHSTPWDLFSAATKSSDVGDTAWIGVPWTLADRWLYSFATRLLWRYADRATRGHPSLRLAEPLLGSPLPVVDCGRLISQDLANTAIELATIDRGGVRSPGQVLEVGAGYGRTAFAILSLFPDCKYTVVDIEPALTITRWYLTQLFPTDRITFLSPAQINEIPRSSMDLAVSISSLSEMTPETRDEYLLLFDRVAAGGLVYLKQWEQWRNPVDGLLVKFDDYSIPKRWVPLLRERAPVQTRFIQALWRVP